MRGRSRYGAQSIRRMKFAVEPFDFAAETTELAFQQAHAIDLDGGFQLQVFKIDCIPMKASRLHCSRFEAVYQLVGKRAAMGMVTAGVLGNEAEQGRTPCLRTVMGSNKSCRTANARSGPKSGKQPRWRGRPSAQIDSRRSMVMTSSSRRSRWRVKRRSAKRSALGT